MKTTLIAVVLGSVALLLPTAHAQQTEALRKQFLEHKIKAANGDAKAQTNLGFCYARGLGVEKDITEAIRWYRKSAEQNHLATQVLLGDTYYHGLGVTQDQMEAIKWYRKAAELGDPHAKSMFRLLAGGGTGPRALAAPMTQNREPSKQLEIKPSAIKAFAEWQTLAEQGNAEAQYQLGKRYAEGDGIPSDYAAALTWFRKAADQNHAKAQLAVGRMYGHGVGVARDMNAAGTWFRKAAAQNDAVGQRLLGIALRSGSGEGDAKGYPEALLWFLKAAGQGDAEAQVLAATMLAKGEGTKADPPEAAKWIRKAAEQEHGAAMLVLGTLIQNGEGVPKDTAEGSKWINRGINKALKEAPAEDSLTQSLALDVLKGCVQKGDAIPQLALARFYAQGRGTEQDYGEAMKWYRKAADQNHDEAQVELGIAYEKGLGVAKNSAEAKKWYRKAAEQGNAEAQYQLGFHLRSWTGLTVVSQEIEAFGWLQKAAMQGHGAAQLNIGTMYLQGSGVSRNLVEAYAYFTLARRSDSNAANWQNSVSFKMSPEQMIEGKRRVEELRTMFPATHGAGSNSDPMRVPISSTNSVIEPKTRPNIGQPNSKASEDRVAINKGEPEYSVGAKHFSEKSYATALILFKHAAFKGNKAAQRRMSEMYSESLGTKQDLVEAYAWITISDRFGSGGMVQDKMSVRMSTDDVVQGRRRAKAILEIIDGTERQFRSNQ